MSADIGRPLTMQQEIFAQAVASGKTKIEAWADAGYSLNGSERTIAKESMRLSQRPKVAARIQELCEKTAKRCEITQDRLVEMGLEAWEMARDQQDPSAMNSCTATIARITGFWQTRPNQGDGQPLLLQYVVPPGAEIPLEGEFTEITEGEAVPAPAQQE